MPFRDFVGRARLGVPREEHEQFFGGLLGDVSEPTAPFGLAGCAGGRAGAAAAGEVPETGWRRGCGSGPGLGVSAATVFHVAWARVLAVAGGAG